MKPINQNPQRYSISKDGKEWRITASPSVPPLVFNFGSTLPNLIPVLEADGIIVKVLDVNLVSPNTLSEIESSLNPHYDIEQNGTVLNRPMGKSIPIITLEVTPLTELANNREGANSIAGVTNVVYNYEDTELIQGLPLSLIQQINWTLTDSDTKPSDTYSYYNFYRMVEAPHYSIEKLNVETLQSDGKLDKTKLKKFITTVDTKLQLLRQDFNLIKDVFFNGKEVTSLDIATDKRITTIFENEDTHTVVRKESTITSIVSTPQTDALSGDLTAGIQSQVSSLTSNLSSLSDTVSKLPSTTTTSTTGSGG